MATRAAVVLNAGELQQIQSSDVLAAGVGVITAVFDGQGSVPATGATAPIVIPYKGTIIGARIIADQSGSAVVDVWKTAYSTSTKPTVANTITASALPTLSSALANKDDTLTGWTTAVAKDDLITFNLNSVTTCTKVTVEILINKQN